MTRTICIAAICLLAGCANRTEINEPDVEVLRGNLRYDSVFVADFTAPADVPNAETHMETAEQACIDYLKSKELFANVSRGERATGPTGISVQARLVEIRILSASQKFWSGGRSYMKIHVKLHDAAGALIAEKELKASPSAAASNFSLGGAGRGLPGSMGVLTGGYVLANVARN